MAHCYALPRGFVNVMERVFPLSPYGRPWVWADMLPGAVIWENNRWPH